MRTFLLAFAALTIAGFAHSQIPSDVAKELDAKLAKMKALEEKASAVTKGLGDLASSGKLPKSDEAIDLMRKMLDEMSAIRKEMEAVTAEVAGIKAWIAGRKGQDDSLAKDVANLKRYKLGGYMQFQYRDTDQIGGSTDGFATRRVRIGATIQGDPKTSFKFSADFATGTSQNGAQLRDAFLTYDEGEWLATAGQQPFPLGYELKRSSSEREFPERAIYNQRMFNGERGRGIYFRHKVGEHVSVEVGGWNALATTDPEQSSLSPAPESRHAMTAGIRFQNKTVNFGVTGLVGERPNFTTGSGKAAVVHPRGDREFVYVDGHWVVNPKLELRGEAMAGKDRVPVTGTPTSARMRTDMSGYHIQAIYKLDANDHLSTRWEQFDPDRDSGGNAINGYGLAWTHYLTPSAKITAAHEVFEDASRSMVGQQRYGVTTIRVQFRF